VGNGVLLEGFLIHKDIIFAFFVQELIGTTFYPHIFEFFADVETTFKHITVDYIFQFCTHESVAFSGFYMQKFDTEIELSVHTDTRSVFNVLCVNHNYIGLN